MSTGLKISANSLVPNGTQIWMQGREVVDVTTHKQAAFYAMFGLMRIPTLNADGVMMSPADFEAFTAQAQTNKIRGTK